MQYNISNMHYRHLYLHPLMHIITYKNGITRNGNIKSKIAIRLLYGRTHSFSLLRNPFAQAADVYKVTVQINNN